MMIRLVVVFAIAVSCIPISQADELVNRADANGDGFVSLHELRAAHYADPEFNQRIEASFYQYDHNGDGLISADERQQSQISAEPNSSRGNVAQTRNRVTADVSPKPVVNETHNFRSLESDLSKVDETRPNVAARAPSEQRAAGETASRSASSGSSGSTETWISQIDTDRSGGASITELIASGDGVQWFRKEDFHAADRNGDGDLNAAELARLISSLERRQR